MQKSQYTLTQIDSAICEVHNICNSVGNEIYVNGNRTDDYVAVGSAMCPYKTIQSAVDAANAGNVIIVSNSLYIEDLTLKNGITIRAADAVTYLSGVYINGKVTYNASDGIVILQGLRCRNTIDTALHFTGTNSQKLFVYACEFKSNGSGAYHAITHDNTNANSELHLYDRTLVQVQDSTGGAECISTSSSSFGKIRADNLSVGVLDDNSNIALNLNGSVSYRHICNSIRGRIVVADNAYALFVLISIYSEAGTPITTNSTRSTYVGNVEINTTVSPVVTGAGLFIYANVVYTSSGKGFASTLNGGAGYAAGAAPLESSENSIYDNTISGLSASNIKIAVDELAGYVTGLSEYTDNAAAIAGGLSVTDFYHTSGTLKVVI